MRLIACVIPAYNAAATLEAVVRGLRAALPDALLIAVDDGSADATHDVAAACCDRAVRFRANRGKGAALRAGFDVAHAESARAVITIDADGQHDPARAPALLGALATADVVIGSRVRTRGTMPLGRRVDECARQCRSGRHHRSERTRCAIRVSRDSARGARGR